MREDLEKILDKTVLKQGDGPNGSGGEWIYQEDRSKTAGISAIVEIPLVDQILTLLDKEIQKAKISELKRLSELYDVKKELGVDVVPMAIFNRLTELEKGE